MMTTRERIRQMLQERESIAAIAAQREMRLSRNAMMGALRRMRLEGEAVVVGRGPNALWCRPEMVPAVTAQIAKRTQEITDARNLRAREAAKRKAESWGESAPVRRIVPAASVKAPRVAIRSVWDLAA